MQCSNDLRSKPDLSRPQKRKREDLEPHIQRIQQLYHVQIGSRLVEWDAASLKKLSFHEGDLAIVQRSDKSYQYVLILGQEKNSVLYFDSQRSYRKAAVFFYSVAKKEEELPPTVPISCDEEAPLPSSLPETLNCPCGPRTLEADPFVYELSCAQPAGVKLVINGKNYYPISSKIQGFATKRLASCGSTTDREILLLDPLNSPLLDTHFKTLLSEILNIRERIGSLSPEQVLNLVKKHMKSRIFFADQPLRKVNEIFQKALADPSTAKFRHSKHPGELIPAIPLERYIAEGASVCRHMSLAACYLLDRLTKEPRESPILDGSVQHIRDNIPMGAHSWAVFIPRAMPYAAPQKWMLDGQFDVLENFAIPEGRARLGPYGDALKRMIERTQIAAQLNGQA